jgi:hypothetical protein
MYDKDEGIRNSVQNRWTPWDSIRRNLRVRGQSDRLTRCSILIREGVAFYSRSLGWVGRRDRGRTLVVDFYQDGNVIDVLVSR